MKGRGGGPQQKPKEAGATARVNGTPTKGTATESVDSSDTLTVAKDHTNEKPTTDTPDTADGVDDEQQKNDAIDPFNRATRRAIQHGKANESKRAYVVLDVNGTRIYTLVDNGATPNGLITEEAAHAANATIDTSTTRNLRAYSGEIQQTLGTCTLQAQVAAVDRDGHTRVVRLPPLQCDVVRRLHPYQCLIGAGYLHAHAPRSDLRERWWQVPDNDNGESESNGKAGASHNFTRKLRVPLLYEHNVPIRRSLLETTTDSVAEIAQVGTESSGLERDIAPHVTPIATEDETEARTHAITAIANADDPQAVADEWNDAYKQRHLARLRDLVDATRPHLDRLRAARRGGNATSPPQRSKRSPPAIDCTTAVIILFQRCAWWRFS